MEDTTELLSAPSPALYDASVTNSSHDNVYNVSGRLSINYGSTIVMRKSPGDSSRDRNGLLIIHPDEIEFMDEVDVGSDSCRSCVVAQVQGRVRLVRRFAEPANSKTFQQIVKRFLRFQHKSLPQLLGVSHPKSPNAFAVFHQAAATSVLGQQTLALLKSRDKYAIMTNALTILNDIRSAVMYLMNNNLVKRQQLSDILTPPNILLSNDGNVILAGAHFGDLPSSTSVAPNKPIDAQAIRFLMHVLCLKLLNMNNEVVQPKGELQEEHRLHRATVNLLYKFAYDADAFKLFPEPLHLLRRKSLSKPELHSLFATLMADRMTGSFSTITTRWEPGDVLCLASDLAKANPISTPADTFIKLGKLPIATPESMVIESPSHRVFGVFEEHIVDHLEEGYHRHTFIGLSSSLRVIYQYNYRFLGQTVPDVRLCLSKHAVEITKQFNTSPHTLMAVVQICEEQRYCDFSFNDNSSTTSIMLFLPCDPHYMPYWSTDPNPRGLVPIEYSNITSPDNDYTCSFQAYKQWCRYVQLDPEDFAVESTIVEIKNTPGSQALETQRPCRWHRWVFYAFIFLVSVALSFLLLNVSAPRMRLPI